MFSTIRKIHFLGIGGIGMSGIAEVLVNLGYEISGSDTKPSPTTERLASLGIRVFANHDAQNVKGVHVVVVSSAIGKHNPELLAAQSERIPVVHRSEMLAELMRLKYGVIIAGTHGKTTTTSILGTVLTAAGLDPTLVIGGRLNSSGSNAQLGKGELFVAEADESDGSFLRLTPTIAVLTNIDRDHLDHYQTFDAIVSAFESFVDKVPFYGAICACIDDPAIQLILPRVRRRLVTFGFRSDADVTARDVVAQGFSTRFTPVVRGVAATPATLRMPGRYNVSNALAAYAVGHLLGVAPDTISQALDGFAGVLHRFTVVGTRQGITVVDDYAHNPKKIQTVLRGAREAFPRAHLCAVFQPHRYSRVKALFAEFGESFLDADSVVVAPIYSAGEQPMPEITPVTLAAQIRQASFRNGGGEVLTAGSLAEAASLAARLAQEKRQDDGCLVLTLGAGDVAKIGMEILNMI